MPSLRSIVRDRRMYVPEPWLQQPMLDEYRRMFGLLFAALKSPDTILINAQSVWADVRPENPKDVNAWGRALDFVGIPRPMPPFQGMWLEASDGGQRFGLFVVRRDYLSESSDVAKSIESQFGEERLRGARWRLECIAAHEHEGSAVLSGFIYAWLTEDGEFLESARQYVKIGLDEGEQSHNIFVLKLRTSWLLNTLSRMNCQNVQLAAAAPESRKSRRAKVSAPSSVWHEIKITSVPKMRAAPSGDAQESHPRRSYWIRGHYADYRRGNGLFGNPKLKAVFWIPEHRRGDEDLGRVIPEYRIQ